MFRRGYKARCVRALRIRSWKRVPMKILKWSRKMPSTKDYDLVSDDEYDTRIPLHPEEAFHYGITFKAKYIGTMDVPRPTSRVEIVAAMRRVRYEFKAKGVKKRKVTVDVSTEGVRITTRKIGRSSAAKLFSRSSRKKGPSECIEIMHHPIYRIFYVSHDSSDLKIFSYIARDGATNVFKCNVFKSNKKSQAMHIVRTVGQAFEVCHKIQQSNARGEPAPSTSSAADEIVTVEITTEVHPAPKEPPSDCGASESGEASTSRSGEASTSRSGEGAVGGTEPVRPTRLDLLLPPPPRKEKRRSPQRSTTAPTLNLPDLPECVTNVEIKANGDTPDESTPLTAQHQVKLLREKLEQEIQQTRAAVAQLLLLKDQLAAEQSARCEAQARTHQLLVHNKELLEHIAALVSHLQEREKGSSKPISAQQLTLLPQTKGDPKEATNGLAQPTVNGNREQINTDNLINLIDENNKLTENIENNNNQFSPFGSPTAPAANSNSATFGGMTNEEIQNYLISKFENMGKSPNGNDEPTSNHPEFYQNCQAFPNIPLLKSHFSDRDIASLLNSEIYKETSIGQLGAAMAQAMSLGHSDLSLCSSSPDSSSNDSSTDEISSDDGAPFIMPLSHNGTLTATGQDGRVRLIVPVSPSGSTNEVVELPKDAPSCSGTSLKVPERLAEGAPITRSTSEKVPNRSESMTAMRSQWTRHTTK